MRGAHPDAECPRCGARFPPAFDGRLVPCARCALVFAPHDVQQPVRRRPALEVATPGAAVVHERLGDGVSVVATPDRIDVSKRPASVPLLGTVAVSAAYALGEPRASLGVLVGLALVWLDRITVTIDDAELRLRERPAPMIRGARVPVDEVAEIAVTRSAWRLAPRFDVHARLRTGAQLRLVHGVHERTAAAIARLLAERVRRAQKPAGSGA